MSKAGFIKQMLDGTDQIYSVALSHFDWYKKVMGTECQVRRVKQHDKYRRVFGSIVNATLPDDPTADVFPYVICISLNDMKKLFQKSVDPLQFYDNKDTLKLGDILVFSRRDQEFKWEITEIRTFNETAAVLNEYTIVGLNEVTSTEKNLG